MSDQQVRLAALLLQESFGEVVDKVSGSLMQHGSSALVEVVRRTDLTAVQVKKCLCVLIQHQLVQFEQHKAGHILYTIDVPSVLLRLRFPRYIHVAKEVYGDAGELVVEDLLQHGESLMTNCVQRVSERWEDAGMQHSNIGALVKEGFAALVQGCFLQRVASPGQELVEPGQPVNPGPVLHQRFELPPNADAIVYTRRKRQLSHSAEENEAMPSPKRARGEQDDAKALDAGVYWHINSDSFHRLFRDKAIVSVVKETVDETAACVMRVVLRLSGSIGHTNPDTGPQLSVVQIDEALPPRPKLSRAELEQYLKVLVDEKTPVLHRVGDSGGGCYTVNFKCLSELLCKEAIEGIVRERFGSKCFRIFRLIMIKKILEQKQVAELAMISGKEAKELLYILLAENFVSVQEVPRTPDHAPSRTFYLFSVNLLHVARMVLERAYKALGNLITRRSMVTRENKRLLDKFQLYERQQQELQGGGDQTGEDVEEVLTPDEKENVERVKRSIAKLEHGELQLDETVMTIIDYVHRHTSP